MSVFRQRFDYPLVKAMKDNTWLLAKVVPIETAIVSDEDRRARIRRRKRRLLMKRTPFAMP